jgi:hypothetical protein
MFESAFYERVLALRAIILPGLYRTMLNMRIDSLQDLPSGIRHNLHLSIMHLIQ